MKKELQQELFDKYPKIFAQKDLPMSQTCMCWGIDCGDGWYTIIDKLCAQIQHHTDQNEYREPEKVVQQLEATQVKEKFGGLRFYYQGGDDYIDGLVSMAESMSYVTCEVCGAPGKRQPGGWIRTLCMKHREIKWYPSEGKKGTVAIDFDGVINSYKSGFVATDQIPDPPVDGAFEFIEMLLNEGFEVNIYSTRNAWTNGREAIRSWCLEHGMSKETLEKIYLPADKPIAKVYIDDRAWTFDGIWPDVREIEYFKPWHGGKSSSQK